ncbi:hypothetical protein PVP_XSN000013 [Vibrio phage PVP-XSN]|uniref:Minor tail protein n=1 Tax=Vibrio phage PVP-XSN TaxID=3056214 RepID=A0AAX3Y3K5_9CAUD|nr:hypothetical protein PVP_XSN000044 [Vibrio phage PVP-XSN]
MTELDLCEAIKAEIENATASLLLEYEDFDEQGEFKRKSPQVVSGYLPPKRSNEVPDFPHVIVRPSNGVTGDNGYTTCTVKLLIGCFSEEYDGYKNCFLVLDELKRAFMEKGTLARKYRFELPFSWEMFDDQPYPEWVIEVESRWSVYTPQEIPDKGVTGYDIHNEEDI